MALCWVMIMVFWEKLIAASKSLSKLSLSNSRNKSPNNIPVVANAVATSFGIHAFVAFSSVFLCHCPSKYSCFSPNLKSMSPFFSNLKGLFAKIQESLETRPETTASPRP